MSQPNKKVYLAGPDVFLPDATEIGARKKQLCAEYGFEGLLPLDNEPKNVSPPLAAAGEIYRGNLRLMQAADFIIAHLTPFRGAKRRCRNCVRAGNDSGDGQAHLGIYQ